MSMEYKFYVEHGPFYRDTDPVNMHWLKRQGVETPIAVFGNEHGNTARRVADMLNRDAEVTEVLAVQPDHEVGQHKEDFDAGWDAYEQGLEFNSNASHFWKCGWEQAELGVREDERL